MEPKNNKAIEFDFEFKAITEEDLKSVNNIVKSLIEYRDQLIYRFNLQNITNESSKDEVSRYNRFVKAWNDKLHGLVGEAELKPLSRKCEEMLSQAESQIKVLRAESLAREAELRAESLAREAQMQSQIDELKRLINAK
jgi:hypothetical protein